MNEIHTKPSEILPDSSKPEDGLAESAVSSSPLRDVIAAHPFFSETRGSILDILTIGATELDIPAGEYIFRQGEPASEFFLIVTGKISLEAHDPGDGTVHIQSLGAGEVLGWSWMFPPFVWHFNARSLEPTRLISLRGGHLLVTAEEDPKFGYHLMKRVAQVVIQRLQAARRELLAVQTESQLKGLE